MGFPHKFTEFLQLLIASDVHTLQPQRIIKSAKK